MNSRVGAVNFLLLALFLALSAPVEAQIAPDAAWRSFDTEHFRVTYEPGLEPLARRAGDRAEHAYAALSAQLLAPPRQRVEIVVADNVDYANGFASILPRDRVVVYAHPPLDNPELSYYHDWLDVVLVHELAHVFHLDTSRGLWTALRRVLGRAPGLFPGATSPGWLTEGLAVYLESSVTGTGRVRGTYHDMVLRTAVLESAFFPIDRASASPTTWPGEAAHYDYGSHFVDYLARSRGPAKLPTFLERYAAMVVPYTFDRAAKRTLGVTLTAAWDEWERGLRAHYLAQADTLRRQGLTEPEVLTGAGRVASFPRYASTGALAYAAATGVDHPAIRVLLPDGSERTARERATAGSFSWTPDGDRLVYEELDYLDPYRVYADLYEAPPGGADHRLTRGARLREPDVHPDGRRVVAVLDTAGTNALVVVDRSTGERRGLTSPSLDVHWSLPRWSPAGDLMAATRWSAGGLHDVVLLDSTGTVVREVTRDRALDTAPTWSPDGRYVVFSSDRTGIPNLFAYDLRSAEIRQVASVATGSFQPAVSPDGRWIAFSYYRSDGYHIARIPFDPSTWRPAPPLRAEAAAPLPPRDYAASAGGVDRPYSPWPSLLPTSWSPLLGDRGALGVALGASVEGVDVVERHRWHADLAALSSGARLEGTATYGYRGWGNPALDLSTSQWWSVAATLDGTGKPLPTALLRRERQAGVSLLWRRQRYESSASLGLGGTLTRPTLLWDDPAAAASLRFRQSTADAGGVVQATLNTSRGFGISLGPQQGTSSSLRAEGHRYLAPFAGDSVTRGYLRFTGRLRHFEPLALPGFARHVVALRADAGAETGSVGPGLGAGGANGGGLGATLGLPVDVGVLGRSVGFPIRGYPEGAQRGNRAFTASAEYRFPIARVERGVALLPLFLERFWGDVFADVGGAWCAGPCHRPLPNSVARLTPLPAVGAELNVDLQLSYSVRLPLRFGLALPLRATPATTPQLYLRIGRAF